MRKPALTDGTSVPVKVVLFRIVFCALFALLTLSIDAQVQLGMDIDGEAVFDVSGEAVAISTDGMRVAIGAPLNDGNEFNAGHVRVYEFNPMTQQWEQLGNDIDGETDSERSGSSVAISADGTRVIIGAPQNNVLAVSAGKARVFEYDVLTQTWVQLGNDIDGSMSYDRAGSAVSITANGNRIAVGASSIILNGTPLSPGYVSVYDYNSVNQQWQQVGTDLIGEANGDFFGRSIDLSDDGQRIGIGAVGNDGNGTSAGHVRVYELNSNTMDWEQLGNDIDGESSFDAAGFSVSLAGDGALVAVGAPRDDDNGNDAGNVRVFGFDVVSQDWEQIGADIDGEAASDLFGWSASMSSSGTRLLVGGYANDGTGSNAGHARVYDYNPISQQWEQFGMDIDGEAANDQSGYAVAISSNGERAAVGARLNSGNNGSSSGHVRVFSLLNCPSPGDLVITEFIKDPTAVSDANGEWFEIKNRTVNDIDIEGLEIRDDGVDSHIIAGSIIVPAGGYVVLARNGDVSVNGGVNADYVYSGFQLANGDDEIVLLCGGIEIDRVNYDDNTFPDPAGASIKLDPFFENASDNDNGNNWCVATTPYGAGDLGTPGLANPSCCGPGEDLVPPIFASAFCGQSTADQTTYDDGWQSGDNDGLGFEAWQLTQSGGANAGFFIASATINGDGDGNGDGDIDTNGEAFGTFAVDGTVNAIRAFSENFIMGSSFSLSWDNGFINNGSFVGFQLRNAAGDPLTEFRFAGGNVNYEYRDENLNFVATTIPFTDEGIEISMELISPTTLSVTLTPLDGNLTPQTYVTGLNSTVADQRITNLLYFNDRAGGGQQFNQYIGDLEVCYAGDCPSNITVDSEAGICGATVLFEVAASDNCEIASITQTMGLPSGSVFPVGTTDNTFIATDAEGNFNPCNFSVTVNGGVPDIAPIADQMSNCPADGFDLNTLTITDNNNVANTTTTFHTAEPTSATDLVNQIQGGDLIITSAQTVFVMVANTTTGCFDVESFMVIIPPDTEMPTTVCNDIQVSLDANGEYRLTAADSMAIVMGTMDNCTSVGDLEVVFTQVMFDCEDVSFSSTQPNNGALDFDGDMDRIITVQDVPTLNDFTLEYYVFRRPVPSSFDRLSGTETNLEFETSVGQTGELEYWFGDQFGWNFTNVFIPSNAWSHVAWVKNGNDFKLYVNGVEEYNSTVIANVDQMLWSFGGNFGGSQTNNCQLDEIRLWSIARSAADVSANYNQTLVGTEAGLILYYSMEDGVGSNIVTDLSGNGLDATLTDMSAASDWVMPGSPASGGTASAAVSVGATVTDESGNSDDCVFSVTVVDDTAPSFPCPAGMSVDLNADCELEIPDLTTGITVDDNCSAALTQSPLATSLVMNLDDGDTQNVTLTATDATGNSNTTPCVVTLTANNPATVSISAPVATNEGDSGTTDFTFTVTRTGPSCAFEVDFATADGSANAGTDYTAMTGTLNFAAGEMSKDITIAIAGDMTIEGDEMFDISLTNPTNGVSLDNATASATILNDDFPEITIGDAMVVEGNSGGVMLSFTVTLDEASLAAVTVNFATADGTATVLNNDYDAATGTLTFSPASTSQTIMINVNGDPNVEADENFTVELSSPTGATIADGSGTGTITNDDSASIVLDANGNSVLEGDAGTTPISLPVSVVGGPISSDVVVNYTLTDGSATLADNDYADAASGSVTIPANATGVNIVANVIGDTNNENDEQFTVTITSIDAMGLDVAIGNSTAQATILDDDFVCPTIGSLTGVTQSCIGESRTLTVGGLATMAEADNNNADFGIRFVYFSTAVADPYVGGTDLGVVEFADLSAGGTAAEFDATFPASTGSLTVYAVLFPTPVEPTCRPAQSLEVQVLACGITNDDDDFPTIADPCVCKNNATTTLDGQFDELVEVLDAPAGETWTVTQISGLFASNSPAPPAAPLPIAVGTVLTEQPTATPGVSNYFLTGIHVDDLGYSILVSNGITTLGISNRCWYPEPEFSNLAASYCRSSADLVLMGTAQLGDGSGEASPEMETFVVIRLSDNATIVNDVEGSAILNIANLPAGRYRVIYTFDAADDDPDASHPGCSQSIEEEFEILEADCGTFPWGGNR